MAYLLCSSASHICVVSGPSGRGCIHNEQSKFPLSPFSRTPCRCLRRWSRRVRLFSRGNSVVHITRKIPSMISVSEVSCCTWSLSCTLRHLIVNIYVNLLCAIVQRGMFAARSLCSNAFAVDVPERFAVDELTCQVMATAFALDWCCERRPC